MFLATLLLLLLFSSFSHCFFLKLSNRSFKSLTEIPTMGMFKYHGFAPSVIVVHTASITDWL